MKILVAALLAALGLAAQPTVSGVSVDALSHSDFRLSWTATGCFQTGQQIRYGFTTAYEGGAGGGIQGAAGPGATASGQLTQFGLSGLLPNTLYHVCAQSSCDSGVTWSSCTGVDQPVTTLPLPAVHPAKPAPPPVYTPTFPDTTGYNTVSISAGCTGTLLANELQVAIGNAVALQPANGTVINIPAGTVCQGTFFFPLDANAAIKIFTSANVSGNTITVAGHGYGNGQQVMVSKFVEGGGFPIQTGSVYGGHLPSPLVIGEIYSIVAATANAFQLSLTSGGAAIDLTDAGSGGGFYVTQWPRYNRHAIVIQTATPDSAFTPPGVRTSPAWVSKMATIQIPGGNSAQQTVAFQTQAFTHDVWIRGLEITTTDDSALASATNDPSPTFSFLATLPDTSHITFDRVYLHGRGAPSRILTWLRPWAGHFATIQNSYLDNLVYPRSMVLPTAPGVQGLAATISAGVLTVTAGAFRLLKGTTCTTNGLTYTGTGGAATSHGYLEVGLDCTPTLILPAGGTASCTGNFSDGSIPHACAVATAASPAFTLDSMGSGARKNFTLADFPIAAGAWGAATDDRGQLSVYNSEGTQAATSGMGRGPYYLLNNFSSGAGNIWHMDDQSLSTTATAYNTVPAGYLWQRNTFNMPLSTIPGNPASDGYQYGHRETIEWKSGTQIKIDGNIFQGSQTDVSPVGCSALWSNNSGFTITDIEVGYNTFRNTPCATAFVSVPHPGQKGPPLNRIYVHDNVTENQDAYTFTSWATNQNHAGVWMTHGYLIEDMIVDHNTIVDARGSSPDMFHLILTPQEGTQITNNILWGNDDAGHHGWSHESAQYNTPSCGGLAARSGMDCLFVQGVGNTLYSYLKNVLVPQFANSRNLTGDAGVAVWQAAYAGLPGAIVQTGSSPPARAAAVGFASFAYGGTGETGNNYRLTSLSPYCSGCGSPATDGGDIGANIEAVAVAQGAVSQPNVTALTGTTAAISFVAPDTFGCAVDWSTDGFSTFHRVANAGGSRLQNVTLGVDGTPLTTTTPYSYQVLCAVNQPQGSFTTK